MSIFAIILLMFCIISFVCLFLGLLIAIGCRHIEYCWELCQGCSVVIIIFLVLSMGFLAGNSSQPFFDYPVLSKKDCNDK